MSIVSCQCSRTQLVKGQFCPKHNTPHLGPPFQTWHKFPKQSKYWNFANKQNTAKWENYQKQPNTWHKNIPKTTITINCIPTLWINKWPPDIILLLQGLFQRGLLRHGFHAKWPRHSCYSPGRLALPDLRADWSHLVGVGLVWNHRFFHGKIWGSLTIICSSRNVWEEIQKFFLLNGTWLTQNINIIIKPYQNMATLRSPAKS